MKMTELLELLPLKVYQIHLNRQILYSPPDRNGLFRDINKPQLHSTIWAPIRSNNFTVLVTPHPTKTRKQFQ